MRPRSEKHQGRPDTKREEPFRPRKPAPQGQGKPDTRNLGPRAIALDAVGEVFSGKAPLDHAIASHPDHKRLEVRDRAFARAIAAAAVRRKGALEAALAVFLDKPLPQTADRGRHVLLCGAAELLVLDNAPHAVVDAWVTLMNADEKTARFAGLANAVLRRVSERGRGAFDGADPLADLPDWLAARWAKTYGEKTARAMARARAGVPPLDLTPRPGIDAGKLAGDLGGELLPTGSIRLEDAGDPTLLPGFAEGRWWVQDAAAALPARLLGPKPGERIADLCAAPGGKTLQIAASGAETFAIDRAKKRLPPVHENLERMALKAHVEAADATQWTPDAPLDAVLLDAPCSATGTLRRRPDVAWAKEEADIASLAEVQSRLLDAAFAMLKPGGRLVYCTCSLEPEEGEDQIAAFLERTGSARLDPVKPDELPELETAIDSQGAVRTRPDMWASLGGLDGFYIARIVKG